MIAEPPRRLFARRRESLGEVGTNAALIAPSANRSRSRLGMRNATLYASMAAPAPKKAATTCSRTTPRMRLVRVARPADAAVAPESSRKKLAQEPSARRTASLTAFPSAFLPASFGMTAFITFAEVFRRRRTGFGNGLGDRGALISSGAADGGR